MQRIRKRIITDPQNRPVAVEIDYEDWVRIERALLDGSTGERETDLAGHVGKAAWPVDGVQFQRSVRGEWA